METLREICKKDVRSRNLIKESSIVKNAVILLGGSREVKEREEGGKRGREMEWKEMTVGAKISLIKLLSELVKGGMEMEDEQELKDVLMKLEEEGNKHVEDEIACDGKEDGGERKELEKEEEKEEWDELSERARNLVWTMDKMKARREGKRSATLIMMRKTEEELEKRREEERKEVQKKREESEKKALQERKRASAEQKRADLEKKKREESERKAQQESQRAADEERRAEEEKKKREESEKKAQQESQRAVNEERRAEEEKKKREEAEKEIENLKVELKKMKEIKNPPSPITTVIPVESCAITSLDATSVTFPQSNGIKREGNRIVHHGSQSNRNCFIGGVMTSV